MTNLNFQSFPPPRRAKGGLPQIFTDEIREQLRANEGEGAVIHAGAKTGSNATTWNQLHNKDGFVFASRKNAEGTVDIWATYDPELARERMERKGGQK